MAPPGKHVMSIFVQYAPYHLKNGTWPEKREALGDTVIDTLERIRAESEKHHPSPPSRHALGSRTGIRPHRGQYFSGRIDLGPALLSPPRAGLGEIPHADQKSLHVRRLHPSGRRRDGGVGAARSAGNSQRHETEVDLTAVATYDAIIVGAGHNGLVTAAYLAKAGKKVLVLERRPIVGGIARRRKKYFRDLNFPPALIWRGRFPVGSSPTSI